MFSRATQAVRGKGRKLVIASGLAAPLVLLVDCAYAEDNIHAPQYPWRHTGWTSTFDHAALRRGYQVYKEVCAACHPMHRIYYRHLVGITHTESQAKAEAMNALVIDGPNDLGEYYERPGKLTDPFPSPYSNENESRAANNGAYPPDLSLMAKARHDALNYIFALLTGFREDLPAGLELAEGQYFNPWFPGAALSMAPPLADGSVDYPDGTVATMSQMAKDVTEFLHWTAEPCYEQSKMWAIPMFTCLGIAWLTAGYHKRYLWNIYATQKITWKYGAHP